MSASNQFIENVNKIITQKIIEEDLLPQPTVEENEEMISFIDAHIPPLEEGKYELTVSQTLNYNASDSFSTSELTQDFYVSGPRFKIPEEDVVAVFPPTNSVGNHYLVMPHISFNRKSLPWEIEAKAPGENFHYPWLCLVLFDESEEPKIVPQKITKFTTNPEVLDIYPKDTIVSTITIAKHLKQIVPADDEIPYLAHIRKTNNVEFSYLICNRLPKKNSSSTVHLISLKDIKPGAHGNEYISLYHWSFTCLEDKPAFKDLLKKGELDFQDFRLPDHQINNKFFQQGYLPLPHFMREGLKTISLYHGPLIPYFQEKEFPPEPKQDPTVLGSRAHPYNRLYWYESEGIPDISFVAAFQLGQLLTIANKKVANVIDDWKRQLYQENKSNFITVAPPLVPPYSSDTATVSDVPRQIVEWVLNLISLKNIPFNYLVPYEDLLPVSSLRVFKIDLHWLKYLLEGVFSIGNEYFTFTEYVPFVTKKYSGFLLRSEVVGDYPNMKIAVYTDEQCTKTIPILIKRLIDKNLLLVVFEGDPTAFDFFLTPEVIHFGIEEDYKKKQRKPDGDSGATITVPVKNAELRVLNIASLAEVIITDSTKKHSSGEFAFQMIEGAPKMRFHLNQASYQNDT